MTARPSVRALAATLAARGEDVPQDIVAWAEHELPEATTPGAVEAVSQAVLAAEALRRALEELRARRRVYWQGNSDRSTEDVQLLALAGTLAAEVDAAVLVADAAIVSPDAHEGLRAAVVTASIAQSIGTRLFDLLGSSAVESDRRLDTFWIASTRAARLGSSASVRAALGRAELQRSIPGRMRTA